jgi:hypothetical protein
MRCSLSPSASYLFIIRAHPRPSADETYIFGGTADLSSEAIFFESCNNANFSAEGTVSYTGGKLDGVVSCASQSGDKMTLVVAADSICQPCRHLHPDGQCDDVLGQLPDAPSKQAYNDALDRRLWAFLKLDQRQAMTVREFCQRVSQNLPGIEKACTHPGEEEQYRLAGLQKAFNLLKIGGLP